MTDRNMSLYRKYRPQTFGDLTGQDHVRDTLRNQIKSGGLSHAYLFTGPRGVGKTTTARLLAKAANCLKLKEAEPCNACAACEAITNGAALDVLEMDAASHTQVDKVRENIVETVRVAPSILKKRVYIIDEVHMLSTASFNALLKTLEEPPAHALFILATTEIHKVPATIISRCQRFDFRKILLPALVVRLADICKQEGVKADTEVLEAIARESDGCARDAESMLEQVMGIADGPLTLEAASLVLPLAQHSLINAFVEKLLARDVAGCITFVNEYADQGVDLPHFADGVIEHLRDLIVARIKGEKGMWSATELAEAIEAFIEARRHMKTDKIPQLGLELAIVKLCAEKNFKSGEVASSQAASEIHTTAEPMVKKKEEPAKIEEVIEAKSTVFETVPVVDLDDVKEKWPLVFEKIKACSASLPFVFQAGEVGAVVGDEVEIRFGYQLHADTINQDKNRRMIEQAALDVIGRPVHIRATFSSQVQDEVIAGLLENFGGEAV